MKSKCALKCEPRRLNYCLHSLPLAILSLNLYTNCEIDKKLSVCEKLAKCIHTRFKSLQTKT